MMIAKSVPKYAKINLAFLGAPEMMTLSLSAKSRAHFSTRVGPGIPQEGGKTVRNYEFTVIIKSGSVEEGKNALKEILSKNNATVATEEDWGMRRLAYAIDEIKDGYYYHAILQASPESVAKIQSLLRLNNIFLRFLFVVQEKKSA